MKTILIAMLIFFHTALSGAAIVIVGEARVRACSASFLKSHLAQVVKGEGLAHVSGPQHLLGVLIKAKANPAAAQRIYDAITRFLADPTYINESVTSLRKRARLSDLNESQLVVCMLSGKCVLQTGLIDFVRDPNPNQSGTQNFIISSPPQFNSLKNEIDFAGVLISNLARYADASLMEDWIAANIKLREAGQDPDPIFARFFLVRSRELTATFATMFAAGGRLAVPLAFYEFMETKSGPNYQSYLQITTKVIIPLMLEKMDAVLSVLWPRGSITPENFLEEVTKIGGEFEKTIERARLLVN